MKSYSETHDVILKVLHTALQTIHDELGDGAGDVLTVDLVDIVDDIEQAVTWDYD